MGDVIFSILSYFGWGDYIYNIIEFTSKFFKSKKYLSNILTKFCSINYNKVFFIFYLMIIFCIYNITIVLLHRLLSRSGAHINDWY